MRIHPQWFIAGMLVGLGAVGLVLLFLLWSTKPVASPDLAVSVAPTATTEVPLTPTPRPSPTATLVPTSTATPTQQALCYQARIVSQSELPKEVNGGDTIEVTWEIENTGTCTWESPGIRFLEEVPSKVEVQLDPEGPIAPGKVLTVRLVLTAPKDKGSYTLQWKLETATSIPLKEQEQITLAFEVTQPEMVMPPVLVSKTITVAANQVVDLDSAPPAEFKYKVLAPNDQSLIHWPLDSPRVRYMRLWLPLNQAFYTCFYGNYGTYNDIQSPQNLIGASFCYITNDLRVGAFRIENVSEYNGTWYLTITYITWKPKRTAP